MKVANSKNGKKSNPFFTIFANFLKKQINFDYERFRKQNPPATRRLYRR
jgi:hypothetical protein